MEKDISSRIKAEFFQECIPRLYSEKTVVRSNDSQSPALHLTFPYEVKNLTNFYFSLEVLKSFSALNH